MPERRTATATAPSTTNLANALVAEFDQEAQTTLRVLDRVPGDKLSWRPHPRSFSLGQLALHIAAAPGNIANAAIPDTMEAPNFTQPEAKNIQEILDAHAQSCATVNSTVGKMDDAKLASTWTLTRNGAQIMSIPRIAFIRSIMLNHIYHHRGQLSVYLRLLEVPVPSIYGPSADENPFA
jgi:uncharacterized damage-inducible protein DinB